MIVQSFVFCYVSGVALSAGGGGEKDQAALPIGGLVSSGSKSTISKFFGAPGDHDSDEDLSDTEEAEEEDSDDDDDDYEKDGQLALPPVFSFGQDEIGEDHLGFEWEKEMAENAVSTKISSPRTHALPMRTTGTANGPIILRDIPDTLVDAVTILDIKKGSTIDVPPLGTILVGKSLYAAATVSSIYEGELLDYDGQ